MPRAHDRPLFLGCLIAAAVGCHRDSGTTSTRAGSTERPQSLTEHHAHETYDAATTSPAASKRCGSVHIHGRTIPIACKGAGGLLRPRDAAKTIVPRSALDERAGFVGAAPLPNLVDHRADGTEGAIRDQGDVGACSAFSLASTIDHALARTVGHAGPVSVLHLWSRYADALDADATSANEGQPIALEPAWPYDTAVACTWVKPTDCSSICDTGAKCGTPDNTARLRADALGGASLTSVTRIDLTTENLQGVLAKGQDVWFGMSLDTSAFENVAGKDVVVPDFDGRSSGAGHAMSIVGYRVMSDRTTQFLLKNSWGTDWGDNGYAWMRDVTLLRNSDEAYVVEAGPVSVGSAPSAPSIPPTPLPTAVPTVPTPTPTPSAAPTLPGAPFPFSLPALPVPGATCLPGTVADASTGACSAACSDGAAPIGGACAKRGRCSAGYADIFGLCVVTPPDRSGLAADDVGYDCGLGGCVYSVPKGTDGCMRGICLHTCPSPKYIASIGPHGFGCSE